MRTALARAPLEHIAAAVLAATVLTIAANWVVLAEVQRRALHARWGALLLLAVVAVAVAAARQRVAPPARALYALAGALGTLALMSAAWSAYPRLTLERGLTFVLVLVAAGSLALAAAGRPAFVRRLAVALCVPPTLFATAGFVMVAVDRDRAIQGATEDMPVRLQGIGMNPNTGSLLYALVLPLVVWLAFESVTRWGRALAGGSGIVLAVSLFASGSRGATVASFAGVVAYLLLRGGSWERRASLVTATALVYAVGVVSADMRSLQPEFVTAVKPRPRASGVVGQPTNVKPEPLSPQQGRELAPGIVLPGEGPAGTRWRRAFPYVREQNVTDVYAVGVERPADVFQPAQSGIFRGSGRLQVWQGALDEARKRPLLGFGFGLEEQVFIDRYYSFEGTRPESSYLGWLLQLGVTGVALFLAIGVAALLRLRRNVNGASAAAAGAVLAGFVVSLMQSYVYSVGNIATLTFWVAVGLLAAATVEVPRPEPVAARRAPRAPEPVEAVAT